MIDSDEEVNVIVVFDFPNKYEPAIELFKLSRDMRVIIEFSQEYEVLIFHFTLFRLTNITYDQDEDLYRIRLENFVSDAGIFTLFKFLWQEQTPERPEDDNDS